jgi:surface-anchored protein
MSLRKPLLWCTLAGFATGVVPVPGQAAVYTSGHGDIAVAYQNGSLISHLELDPDAVIGGGPVGNPPNGATFAPEATLIYVADPPVLRPSGSAWDFFGVPAGQPLHVLPQSEDPARPFLGLASETLVRSQWASLSVRLVSLEAPVGGHFALYQTDAFGSPLVKFDSADGIGPDDLLPLVIGGHDHYNWAFTQPGMYRVGLVWQGEHRLDGPRSVAADFRFGVTQIPEPGLAALLSLSLVFVLWRHRLFPPAAT